MTKQYRKPRLLLIAATSYRAEEFLKAARQLRVQVVVGSDYQQSLAAALSEEK